MMQRIEKVAILGSGIMGSRIACHFANVGIKVLLLDRCKDVLTDAEIAQGLSLSNPATRNSIVNQALQLAVKSNPSPLYKKEYVNRITTGNFDDDMQAISQCQWIIEVVVENIDIKKNIFDAVEKYRSPKTLVTTNTSGIPIHLLTQNRSQDFKNHFCGSHFFNPPRYLPLLEIIPGTETLPEVTSFLMHFGNLHLGKTTVICKDTPAFIANRIGVFSIIQLFQQVKQLKLNVTAIDALTGPIMGRPKSATFRTTDVVGLDTLVHVANNLQAVLASPEREMFQLPDFITQMINNKWLGDKTKQGFYKKVKDENGKSQIQALNLDTLTYEMQPKQKFATLEAAKSVDDLNARMQVLIGGTDVASNFYKQSFASLFSYTSLQAMHIADNLYGIDDAMCAGFGWELGPFEIWDAIGLQKGVNLMQDNAMQVPQWVTAAIEAGITSFYQVNDGQKYCYNPLLNKHERISGRHWNIDLNILRKTKKIWSNSGCTLTDMDNGIVNLEFHTKMNSIGGEVVAGVLKAIEIAEANHAGLVIGNQGANFSAGANLALIYMMALEQDYDEIDMAIRMFQKMNMSVRYSNVPVVVATHGLTLGGGCEMALHADKVVAAAESYIGLVEFGVGLIPGGGGSKEFAIRIADEIKPGDIGLNILRDRFLTIGQAKVSTSAAEAYDLGILRNGTDTITYNKQRLLYDAKNACLQLAQAGYQKPQQRQHVKVFGQAGLGVIYAGANAMVSGNYMSEHDKIISEKLGYVICGGNLSEPTMVSEKYLLDLEREAFLSLCGMKKTLQRIQSILTTGKVLRN
jgi:3-hydroxyacyl-CoA dehydrogenase